VEANQQARVRRQNLLERIHEADKWLAVDEVVNTAVHDLNNLLMVLTMEVTRLQQLETEDDRLAPGIAAISQVVSESRSIVGKMAAPGSDDNGAERSYNLADVVDEVADLLRYASTSDVYVQSDLESKYRSNVRAWSDSLYLLIYELGRLFVEAEGGALTFAVDTSLETLVRLTLYCTGSAGIAESSLRVSKLKELATQMNGRLSVDSNDDNGSLAVLTLPANFS